MSRKIEFFVPGAPVGKGRPRAARRGAGVVMFTPGKTADYERLVAATAAAALSCDALAAHQLLDGPLEAVLEMRFPVPASWSKARRARALAGAEWHTSKPDADNVAKAVLDACNGVVFRDDSQIVMLTATKGFSEAPGVRVVIRECSVLAGIGERQ